MEMIPIDIAHFSRPPTPPLKIPHNRPSLDDLRQKSLSGDGDTCTSVCSTPEKGIMSPLPQSYASRQYYDGGAMEAKVKAPQSDEEEPPDFDNMESSADKDELFMEHDSGYSSMEDAPRQQSGPSRVFDHPSMKNDGPPVMYNGHEAQVGDFTEEPESWTPPDHSVNCHDPNYKEPDHFADHQMTPPRPSYEGNGYGDSYADYASRRNNQSPTNRVHPYEPHNTISDSEPLGLYRPADERPSSGVRNKLKSLLPRFMRSSPAQSDDASVQSNSRLSSRFNNFAERVKATWQDAGSPSRYNSAAYNDKIDNGGYY